MTQPLNPHLQGWPYAPAECVRDQAQIDLTRGAMAMLAPSNLDDTVVPGFCDSYRAWIQSTTLNSVWGLDQYPVASLSQGTTQAFDHFYLRHASRRFRCLPGEYAYHTLSWQQYWPNQWQYLSEHDARHDLQPGDAVVMSWPFADLGNQHPALTMEFLDRCHELGLPVLIDAAFFGVCGNQEFRFDHPAIQEVCFSLSKSFPVSGLRIGMRLSRQPLGDGLEIYHRTQYVNKLSAALGLYLISAQGPDQNFQRWRDQQEKFCKTMHLTPSDCVLFGLDYEHRYDHYNRGSSRTNRLCFSRYLESGKLVPDVRAQ